MKMSSKTSVSSDRSRYSERRRALGAYEVNFSHGVLVVSIGEQALWQLTAAGETTRYDVSTSRYGSGCAEGSNQTPLGVHRIEQKIGDGAPLGTRFRARQPVTDDRPDPPSDTDPITSRILWLRGLEPGRNSGDGCDSHARFIYIHGTPHEADLGRPASAGCVRMRAADVIDLFDRVRQGTPVLLEA